MNYLPAVGHARCFWMLLVFFFQMLIVLVAEFELVLMKEVFLLFFTYFGT